MSAYCRFEILLPLEFNDGRPVPRESLAEAAVEIQRRFGGVSWEPQAIEGIWRQGGIEYPAGSIGVVAAPDPHQRVRQALLENSAVAVTGSQTEY